MRTPDVLLADQNPIKLYGIISDWLLRQILLQHMSSADGSLRQPKPGFMLLKSLENVDLQTLCDGSNTRMINAPHTSSDEHNLQERRQVDTPQITSRLQKGGALIDDMRQLVFNWSDQSSERSPFQKTARILQKSTRARAADTYRRAFLPRFINGRPPDAWRLAKELEAARPSIEIIRPFYYWITARAEPLLYRFVTESLFEKAKTSDPDVRIDETVSWIRKTLTHERKRWSPTVQLKVARGLLAALRDFGVLEGATRKRIAPLHLPLEAFCLIAFCLTTFLSELYSLIEHPDWKLFLLTESGVERLLLESHQHGWLHYQAAGRVRRVEFPAEEFGEYIRVVLRPKP